MSEVDIAVKCTVQRLDISLADKSIRNRIWALCSNFLPKIRLDHVNHEKSLC